MSPPVLRDRVAFDPPLLEPDGKGGRRTGWDTDASVTTWAEIRYRRGGEEVQAGGQSVTGSYKVRIRQSTPARKIRGDWRMRDLRTGAAFNLREVDALSDRHWVWIVAETGVAT